MHRGDADNSSSLRSDRRSAPSIFSPSHFLSGIRYEYLVSGVAGGTLATLVLHPLDLIKVRFAGWCSVYHRCGGRHFGLIILTA